MELGIGVLRGRIIVIKNNNIMILPHKHRCGAYLQDKRTLMMSNSPYCPKCEKYLTKYTLDNEWSRYENRNGNDA